MSPAAAPNTTLTSHVTPRIAIIGAGVSGLRCSQLLLAKGYNVTILEARSHVGGRIQQTSIQGTPVDIGPNWCHGWSPNTASENPIVNLAKEADAGLHSFAETAEFYDEDGSKVDPELADALHEEFWETVEEAQQYSKKEGKSIGKDESFWGFCEERAERLAKRAADGNDGKKAVDEKKRIFLKIAEMWGTIIGSSVKKQSLRFFHLEEPIEGPNFFLAGTHKNIISKLAEPSVSSASLQLNSPVTSIETHPTTPPTTSVTTACGTSVYDAVIVTTPLGCLKRDTVSFTPPLPPRIQQSINSLSYGHLEKVFLRFPHAFWQSSTPIQDPDFINFLSPSYALSTNPKRWHISCFSLANLKPPHAQPTLMFYVYGETSSYFATSFSPADTPRGKRQFSEFFKPYYSRLPGYSGEDVVEAVATRWSVDEYAGWGSYTNFQVGLEEGEKDVEVLREGVPERRLWLAGEHTAPTLALACVSGAYMSGERTAEYVVKAFEGTDVK